MRISDWSSDVCSSDLHAPAQHDARHSGLSSPCHRKGSKVTVTSRTTESWLPHSSHVPHATAHRSAFRHKTRSVQVATHIVGFVQFRASNTAVSRQHPGYAPEVDVRVLSRTAHQNHHATDHFEHNF